MRLVSKLHDYYDSPFRGSAGDPKYVFVRDSKDIQIPNIHFIQFSCQVGSNHYNFDSGLVGFCGKIYPYLKMSVDEYIPELKQTKEYYYNMDDLARNHPNIVKGNAKLASYSRYVHRLGDIENWLKNGSVSSWGWSYTACTDSKLLDLFLKYRVAYFTIPYSQDHNKTAVVTLYPVLKDYSFFKVFDVYTTFQKIEIFLMNDLVRRDEINIVIPDKLKAQSKGFNKWSFRKMKGD